MNCRHELSEIGAVSPGSEEQRPVAILAVGSPEEWSHQGHQPPSGGGLAFVSFEQLSEDILEQYSPTIICSPVLAQAFDCVDLAALLNDLGYRGPYRAMSKDVPCPELIVREIRHLFPNLDFGILTAH